MKFGYTNALLCVFLPWQAGAESISIMWPFTTALEIQEATATSQMVLVYKTPSPVTVDSTEVACTQNCRLAEMVLTGYRTAQGNYHLLPYIYDSSWNSTAYVKNAAGGTCSSQAPCYWSDVINSTTYKNALLYFTKTGAAGEKIIVDGSCSNTVLTTIMSNGLQNALASAINIPGDKSLIGSLYSCQVTVSPTTEWCAPVTSSVHVDFGTVLSGREQDASVVDTLSMHCTSAMAYNLKLVSTVNNYITLSNGMKMEITANGSALGQTLHGQQGTNSVALEFTLSGNAETSGAFSGEGVLSVDYP